MASAEYIKNADPIVTDLMQIALNNLSDILGDYSGRIGIREIHFLTRNLKVSSLSLVTGVDTSNPTPQDELLGVEVFDPLLSLRGRDLYLKISKLDKNLTEFSYDPDSKISDSLAYLNDQIASYMSYAYLESYSLYTGLVEYVVGNLFSMSIDEIDRLLSNLRFIATKIGSTGDQEEVYNLLYVVNHIQRTILFIRRAILMILG